MYTTKLSTDYKDHWIIFDPNGQYLFLVLGSYGASEALKHLNR